MLMPDRRKIDERDVDRLLAALTDTQIASLYGMSEVEVFKLRQERQSRPANSGPDQEGDGKSDD
jgi:hypothetical protein